MAASPFFPIRLNLLDDDIFSALLCQDSTLIVLSKVANLIVAVVVKSLQDHFLHFNPEVVHQQPSRQLKEALLHFWFDLNHLSIQLYPIHEVNHHVQHLCIAALQIDLFLSLSPPLHNSFEIRRLDGENTTVDGSPQLARDQGEVGC